MVARTFKIYTFMLFVLSSADDDKSSLLRELGQLLGDERSEAIETRTAPLEAVLRPLVRSLPKNEHGRLNEATSRYALHRLFVEHRGWFVKGLFADATGRTLQQGAFAGDSLPASPAEILQDNVPSAVKQLFDYRLEERGFGLGEVAVLGATLEEAVHKETLKRVAAAFKHLKRPMVGRLSAEDVKLALDHVMKAVILEVGSVHGEEAEQYLNNSIAMTDVYPSWPELQKYMRGVQAMVAPEEHALSFQDVAHTVDELLEHYGRWQGGECSRQKDLMLSIESSCQGRVELKRFYRANLLEDRWQFAESEDYLRSLGALDESHPGNPLVVIPNYVLGASNCVGSSRFYSQCCLDPCDGILAKLEQELGTPEARAADVAEAVTFALNAPWGEKGMPDDLMHHLAKVAIANHGKVPLHGRLFAQWLHFAFPRECPLPPALGAEVHSEELPEAYTNRTGKNYLASDREKWHLALRSVKQKTLRSDPSRQCAPLWQSGEILLAASKAPASSGAEHLSSIFKEFFSQRAAWIALVALTSSCVLLVFGSFLRKKMQARSPSVSNMAPGPLLPTDTEQPVPLAA